MHVLAQAERANPSSLHIFALLGPSVDLMMSTHTDEGDLLSVIQSTSVPEAPSQIYSEIMFYQLSGPPLAHQADSKINHHTWQEEVY